MPTVDEYQALADSSGLHDVQVWGENADRFFPDQEAMVRCTKNDRTNETKRWKVLRDISPHQFGGGKIKITVPTASRMQTYPAPARRSTPQSGI
jgi:hypothetical protein